MSEFVEIVDLGFSTADAENVTFRFDGSDLVLDFIDWQGQRITIKCENTLGFRFQNAEYALAENEGFDASHQVHNSEWIKEHFKQGFAGQDKTWHHYKLNFNAECVVEVLCSKLAKA